MVNDFQEVGDITIVSRSSLHFGLNSNLTLSMVVRIDDTILIIILFIITEK